MIIETLQLGETLTSTEKNIAKFILENPLKFKDMSTEELAKATYSSPATIVRLSKKVGAKNYNTFKLLFIEEYLETEKIDELLKEEPLTKQSSISDIVNMLPNLYEHALKQTKLFIDLEQMKKVSNKLRIVEKIDVYGLGISYSIAQQSTFKFQSIGIECNSFDGINEHYIANLNSTKNRLAILISITGKNPTIIKIAKYLKERGIYTIAISTSVDTELFEICDELFQINDNKLILSMEVLPIIISAQYIIDIMFSILLKQKYDQNIDASLDIIKNPFSNYEK
ncbi:MurR/RpiR family transcriptional regulator [Mammaliicoccus sciuri]|uniref:MurR/RpiR family transcriptional regulator n=1 Tax=Mammaliicoccus sciuri TaxID=1296 RepID=UPI0021CF9F6D|nr:MurR/RpiR family transcriptional regulator [Mammaliicoccus sciuri]UXU83919.1 MurR/RpiR family transcriptional regulator [Mammaliicoccus sciuri]UXU93766.1 MurR/RpiR family transcriptional regulator [Mammaliicoccus sciuri]UXV15714.1 MurR/RpiR family transcriptional regulator [Mammaliicoccus sciuri]UXV23976.1 MurR/RpiR family transcriptional regulator [Mammaliicoccus sciuri]UXV26757.1 MurR/RpiR family transcriptional regulator [Mammaliicoccus sciuri]